MNQIQSKSLAKLSAVVTLLLAGPCVFAVGPSYQYVPDAVPNAIAPFNDIVSLSNTSGFDGSGTVIGEKIIPYSATQSEAMLTILTANHVAIGNITTASFGAGPNAYNAAGVKQNYTLSTGVNPVFKTYTLFDTTSNPNNLPEDISVMQAGVIYNTGALPAALSNIVFNYATVDKAFGGTPGPQSIGFTQAGYGQGGVWNGTNANIGNAYNGNGIYEARRFQNNTSTNLNAPAIQTYGNYFQPVVNDKVQQPSIPGATGGGFDGDSGGPWFTGGFSATVTDSPQNPNDYNTTVKPAVAPVTEPGGVTVPNNSVLNVNYSDDESAVFVAISQAPGTNYINLNSTQLAVPLLDLAQTGSIDIDNESTQGSYEWAMQYANNPLLIPEPGTLSLLAITGLAMLRRRTRR